MSEETREEAYERGRREREAEIVEAVGHLLNCVGQKLVGEAFAADREHGKKSDEAGRYHIRHGGHASSATSVWSLFAEWGHQHPGFCTEPGSHKKWLGEEWADLVSCLPHVKAKVRRDREQREMRAEQLLHRGIDRGVEA